MLITGRPLSLPCNTTLILRNHLL